MFQRYDKIDNILVKIKKISNERGKNELIEFT